MKRFCGFCPGQFGDLYMMTVAARCLKRVVPDSHLTFVIGNEFRECASLFINHPHIDRIHVLHKVRDGFDEVDLKWIADQRFDHVFNPMQDHDHSTPWYTQRNQSLEAAFMHHIPTEGDSGKIEMVKWFKEYSYFQQHVAFSPWPSFHEGTSNPKAIPPDMAQKIVDMILVRNLGVLQVGGPNEPQIKGALKLGTDYFESVRNVLGCKAMIMGDSGLNWLLSGYDFPVLGLYSTRHFGEFLHNIQPINPNGLYLSAAKIDQISLDTIAKSIDTLLA